jgi:hypothetical protein
MSEQLVAFDQIIARRLVRALKDFLTSEARWQIHGLFGLLVALMFMNGAFTALPFSGVLWTIGQFLFGIAIGYAVLGTLMTIYITLAEDAESLDMYDVVPEIDTGGAWSWKQTGRYRSAEAANRSRL